MQNNNQNQGLVNTQPQSFKSISKKNFTQMGMDFKPEGNLAIGLSLINSLQSQMKVKFDQIDGDAIFVQREESIQPTNQNLASRCLNFYQNNMALMGKILKLKEMLAQKMYLGSLTAQSMHNQNKLNEIMADIRHSKIQMRSKLNSLHAKKLYFESHTKPSPSDPHKSYGQELDQAEQEYLTLQKWTLDLRKIELLTQDKTQGLFLVTIEEITKMIYTKGCPLLIYYLLVFQLKSQNSSKMTNRNHITALVNDYNRSSAQIHSLNRTPNSILTKLDPHFTSAIESQSNPSLAYKQAMSHLCADQLRMSLLQEKSKIQGEEMKKDSLDGVLCQLEKNSLTHQLLQQKKMQLQQQRKERFIDQDKRKSYVIDTFIDKQYDSDVFNHQSDQYQQHQRHSLQHSLSMLQLQRQSKLSQHQKAKKQKQWQFEQRMKYQRNLYLEKQQERQLHKNNQMKYQEELQNLVIEKKQRDATLGNYSVTLETRRHNPITNPIEYHIENPYLLKRMAEQQKR